MIGDYYSATSFETSIPLVNQAPAKKNVIELIH